MTPEAMGRLARAWQDRPRLLPAETRAHLRNATRENLLAVRSLLDVAIVWSEGGRRPDSAGPARPARRPAMPGDAAPTEPPENIVGA